MTNRDDESLALADGFASHVVGWARERQCEESSLAVLYSAARRVSLATSAGDVCVHLAALGGEADPVRSRQQLLESGVVGTPSIPDSKPLILDGEGRLYLHRYFDYESRLAKLLALRRTQVEGDSIPERVKARLGEFFSENAKSGRADWQKLAVAMALQNKLTVISGGPGTGKTTTLTNLLVCLLESHPDCRIALAAPTGKAAARMLEAIHSRAAKLGPEIRSILPTESFTVHRLLGVSSAGKCRYDSEHLLPLDALIVDEASMLDLALATKLFEAVPISARIVLLGDKDQLASVESGAVFSEISANPSLSPQYIAALSALTDIPADQIEPAAPLASSSPSNSVIWFSENYRFAQDSALGRLAHDINTGSSLAALSRMRENTDGTLFWIPDGGPTLKADSAARLAAGYAPYLEVVRDGGQADPAVVFEALMRFRVLCPIREGARGVNAVNKLISRHFRETLDEPSNAHNRSEWYSGRPVMVLRNDYVLKLFNGDVGIALRDQAGKVTVFFPDGIGGFKRVSPLRLPEYETAFALTVHKAQGSEFDEVALILPAEMNPGLTRELLYTAITRSRRFVTVIGGEQIVERAIQSPTRRHSGLIARLNEATC